VCVVGVVFLLENKIRMSSTYNTISNALTTGTIIAIAVGSIGGLAVCIGIIIVIVCVVKHTNRRQAATRGMVIQPAQTYPYPQQWQNQYPPNTTSVANYPPNMNAMGNYPPGMTNNYPPTYSAAGPPYTATAPYYSPAIGT
jgi:hypothetical protein